ncbi:alginate export family protein [Phytohalomonas tamaricis]|uniref:alginate export family protein n=1 Tax=Phytohalomonas tamaricis TaxID=2081032 RepID=UPI000D0AFD35|nr:alginate export family protein [Phytohalomonas tamaricis]
MRLTFDGGRATYNPGNGYKLDSWAMRPADNLRSGSFNDSSTDSGDFYGLYGTIPVNKVFSIDLYEMSYLRDERTLNGVSGEDHRHTPGTRLFGQNSIGIDYSADVMYQSGEFAGDDIRAWGLWSAVDYTLETPHENPARRCVLMWPAVMTIPTLTSRSPSTRCSPPTAISTATSA